MLSAFPADIQAFLLWLAFTPGALFSQLDAWPWFANLSVATKWTVQIVASGLAAAGLTLLSSGLLPAGTISNVNAGYVLIVQIIVAILSNFGTHIVVNKIIRPIGLYITYKAAVEKQRLQAIPNKEQALG